MYVDASDMCNDLAFNLAATGSTVSRSWTIKASGCLFEFQYNSGDKFPSWTLQTNLQSAPKFAQVFYFCWTSHIIKSALDWRVTKLNNFRWHNMLVTMTILLLMAAPNIFMGTHQIKLRPTILMEVNTWLNKIKIFVSGEFWKLMGVELSFKHLYYKTRKR